MTDIAVLDDAPATLTTIDDPAAEQGWTVQAWSDPLAICACVEERPPDVLIADLLPCLPISRGTLLQEPLAVREIPLSSCC